MNRSPAAWACSGRPRIRIRMAWCMVGTAVYQVGATSVSHSPNLNALKPGVQHTAAPADSDAVTAAISPWMWNSGMMLRQVSAGPKPSVAAMCRAEAATLPLLSGTIFGRAVVPEVCSTSAGSPGRARRTVAAPLGSAEPSRRNAPALSGSACKISSGICSRLATSLAGPASVADRMMAAGCRSDR